MLSGRVCKGDELPFNKSAGLLDVEPILAPEVVLTRNAKASVAEFVIPFSSDRALAMLPSPVIPEEYECNGSAIPA
jgi:hypothetical protein